MNYEKKKKTYTHRISLAIVVQKTTEAETESEARLVAMNEVKALAEPLKPYGVQITSCKKVG